MLTRNRMLATGSTVALAAGGLFFSAAPASADLDSPACLAAQAAFIAALDGAGVDAGLLSDLDIAIAAVVSAQDALDLAVGGTTQAQIDAQAELDLAEITLDDLIVDLGLAQGNLQAALQLVADADADIEDAQLALGAVVTAQADLVAAAEADLDLAIQAQLDATADLAVANQAVIDATLTVGTDDDAAAALLVTAAVQAGVDANLAFATATTNLGLATTASARAIAAADADVAAAVTARGDLLLELDIDGLTEAVDALELDVEAQLQVVADLNTALIAAGETEAIAAAALNLQAAIDALAALQVQLDGEALDLVALEALFDASIAACGVDGTVGGPGVVQVDVDIDIVVDNNGGTGGSVVVDEDTDGGTDGSVVVGGGNGGNVTSGGTTVTNRGGTTSGGAGTARANRGVNVQTAAETEDTSSAAGLGLLGLMTAGLGVAAATVGLRRKAQNNN
jgi:hypothetical protein